MSYYPVREKCSIMILTWENDTSLLNINPLVLSKVLHLQHKNIKKIYFSFLKYTVGYFSESYK